MFPELDKFWSLLNRGSAMGQAEKVLLDGLKSVYDERLKTYKVFFILILIFSVCCSL